MSKPDKSIDPNSKAIELLALGLDLLEGKKGDRGEKGEQGEPGKDSVVPGPQGPQGERGEKGDSGEPGKDGVNGKNGRDGADGKDGEKGEKGDPGEKGEPGQSAEAVAVETIVDITMPIIVQNVQKAVAAKTYDATEVAGLAEFVDGRLPPEEGLTWSFLATTWSAAPSLNDSITGGDVYDYTLSGTTRYRFVPSTYDATEDAFYETFEGGVLSDLIVTRG